MVRYDTLRLLLALTTHQGLNMVQFDIRTAFLYGNLEEDIYMKIPQGLKVPKITKKVCKLRKALYSLKQASRCWNSTFKRKMKKHGFVPCSAYSSVFVGKINNVIVYIVLFVDDGIIICKFIEVIYIVLNLIRVNFEATVCKPKMFVGLQIDYDREKKIMFLHQSEYINKLINRFKLDDAKPSWTPEEKGAELRPAGKHEGEKFPFRELVGSLMFLSAVTRPDISHAVNVVSRFLDCYGKTHWKAAKRILRYVKATLYHGIVYRGTSDSLQIV